MIHLKMIIINMVIIDVIRIINVCVCVCVCVCVGGLVSEGGPGGIQGSSRISFRGLPAGATGCTGNPMGPQGGSKEGSG